MGKQQSPLHTTVVRVRGLPKTDAASAQAIIAEAINDNTSGQVDYKISIVPACDRANECVGLVDFSDGLPDFLASLKTDPLGSCEIETADDDDLSFDCHFNGFTQLYDLMEEKDTQADIVAICGIGGHAYGSWQGKGNTRRMWLRHFLRRDLPLCRVMTYGYNSKLNRRDFATIEDYVGEFLDDLKRIRTGEARMRPIIFLAHSFGGLILARSLIKAVHTNESDHPTIVTLHRATYGMLFFAVPHLGLDVEDMSRIMGAENNPKAGLLNRINVNSTELRAQLKDFKDILYDRRIVSFFETEQSQRLQRTETGEWKRSGEHFTSLERDNAVLNLPPHLETRLPLHCDHSTVIKYDNKNADGYSKVLFHLQSFVTNAPEVVLRRFQFGPLSPALHPTGLMQSPWIGSEDTQIAPQLLIACKATPRKESPRPLQAVTEVSKVQNDGQAEELHKKSTQVSEDSDQAKVLNSFEFQQSLWYDSEDLQIIPQLPARKAMSQKEAQQQAQAEALDPIESMQSRSKNTEIATRPPAQVLKVTPRKKGPQRAEAVTNVSEVNNCERVEKLRRLDDGFLAHMNHEQEYAKPGALCELVFPDRLRLSGTENFETLTTMSDIGRARQTTGDHVAAVELLSEALTGLEIVLGKDHVDVLAIVHSLSRSYQTLKRFRDGEVMARRAAESRERVLGPAHRDTLESLNKAGWFCAQQDKNEAAESMYVKCLAGRDKTTRQDSTKTISIVHELSVVYEKLGKVAEARATCLREATSKEKTLGKDHAQTKEARERLNQLKWGHGIRKGWGEAKSFAKKFDGWLS